MWKLTVIIEKKEAAETEELLFASGATSVTTEPFENEIEISALFNTKEELEHYNAIARSGKISQVRGDEITGEPFKGGEIIDSVFVVPEELEMGIYDASDMIIVLDPKGAFGDGFHPSTKDSMQFMKRILDTFADCEAVDFLDLGTGTGILSVYAYKRGVREICALDCDGDSIISTVKNFSLNNVSTYHAVCATIDQYRTRTRFNLVAANLGSAAIVKNMKAITTLCAPGASVILSGIMTQWKEDLLTSASPYFEYSAEIVTGEWLTVLMKKKG